MKLLPTLFFVFSFLIGFGQRVPNESENIDYLVTFGQDALDPTLSSTGST